MPRTSIAMDFIWTEALTSAHLEAVFEVRVRLLVVALRDPAGLMARARTPLSCRMPPMIR